MRQRKRSGRKMISALLAFILLLSMLPAPLLAEEPGQLPDIQEAAVITGFEAITVDAGSAGSAGYADSEAVITYLEANHAQVQAITTPDSSTVNIAVTGWTAPSGDGAYNPAVAGSYTFTATLGQLPEVYANPNNLTATAEVVVAEAEGGVAGRLEAPAISSAYDEQNNSYTVTISTTTAGAIKYRLSGSESGTGEWLDYTGPFVVDSANEQISQGLLYVSAYAASIETGTQDSEVSQTLLDFRGEVDPGDIEDGEYIIPVSLWHASDNAPSMGNAALEQTASLVVADGQGTLQMTFKPLTFMGMTGYLSQMDLLSNIEFNENNYPVNYTLIPATVISTYDVVDDFNKPDSADPNCAGKPYPKDLSVPVVLAQEYTWAHVYVPVMGSMGFGDQVARIKLDWNGLTEAGEESIEITAFDPITIDAGTTAAAAYADAAAVITYLNTNYVDVTANGGAVSVPVTAWTDTDGYNPATVGSYTFTATLGDIPAGYTLGEGVTATAEVVVAEAPVPTVTGVTVSPAEVSVAKGGTQSFSAQVAGENNPSQEVTWSIVEETAAGTSISDAGLLTVAADETLTTLTVTATSVADLAKSGTTIVTMTEPAVSIPDANLKAGICTALGRDPQTYTVTVGDMESLTALDLSNRDIKDLTGLWTAVNLESLDLSGNPLTKNFTTTAQYNNVLAGIGNLINLKELDLSHCDLGVCNANASYTYPPNSITRSGVCELAHLEKLDLSHNKMKAYFYVSKTLPNLKELDLSGNYLSNFLQLQAYYFPAIESIALSNNYLYADESEYFYQGAMAIGLEKFTLDNMRNLAELFAIRLTNAGTTKDYRIEPGTYTVDVGSVFGNNFTFACLTYSTDDTVKVTVNGEKYTALMFDDVYPVFIPLNNLEIGKNHTVKIEVMHLGGDTRTYTLKFRTTALPSDEGIADSAGIVDANLQAAVCSKLGKDPYTYVVTQGDMASFTGLLNGSLAVYGVTDAEGIQYATGLTSLHLRTGTFTTLPDLSGLTNLTTLTISSTNLTAIPNLSGLSALKKLEISGGPGLTIPAGLDTCTALTNFTVRSSDGFDFTGLEAAPALTSLTIDSCQDFTLPASLKDLSTLTTLVITNCGLTQVPGSIGEMTQINTFNLSDNQLSDFPDLSGLTALTALYLSNNAFADIPANIVKLTGLQQLNMAQNSMPAVTSDLSPLTQLKILVLSDCGLREFPASILELSALTSLDLSYNNLRSVDGSMAELQNLTTLRLPVNRLDEVPAGIKDLTALTTLDIGVNYYTDLPADLADYLPNLKTFGYGGYIRYGSSVYEPDPESNAAAVVAALRSRSPAVSVTLSQTPLFSSLRKLQWDFGEITQIHEVSSPSTYQEYALAAPKDTTSITFTLTAMLEDTAITVNGTSVANGGSIEVPVAAGANSVEIVCHNGNTTTYKLTIFVGSYVGGDFPAEGRKYNINMRVWHRELGRYSMADGYFKHSAEMTYSEGLFAVYVTVTKDSWITKMSYRNAAGEYVEAEHVARDQTADTAVYKLYLEEDALDEDLYISPYVVPMGSSPVCKIIFDPTSIIDITGDSGEPEPGPIEDGEYTLPVRLWHAVDNQPSMGNNALEQTAKLVVEDGQGTLHLTFKSLTFMGMEGYLSQLDLLDNIVFNENNYPTAYDLIPATIISTYDVVDDFNKPDSSDPNCAGKPYPKDLSVPVVLNQEYTWVHVYVPVMGSMGFGDQVARIKLDWSGLAVAGDPDPDAAPVHEINDDGDGVIEITSGDFSGISDPRQNVGLSASGTTLNIPAQYLSDMFAGDPGATLKFEAKESPADTKNTVFQLLGDDDELAGAFDLNLTLGTQSVTDLGGRVKIIFSLTDAQVTALQNADSRKLCHYDPVTGTLTDMNAVFDLAAKTVTLYTDHLSTYVLIVMTAPGSGGTSGSDPGSSHGLANGTYNIKVKALQEYANDESMANQFFTERAELKVAGEKITVSVVMHGTATSAELSSGIKMSYINALQYKNGSGSWVNAVSSRDNTADTLTVRMTVSSLDDLYMRVQTDYMGPEYKVFRLVFNRSSLQEGRLTPAATPEKQDAPGLANTDAKVFTGEDGVQVRFPDSALSGLTAPVQITIAPGEVKTPPQAEKTAVVLDPSKYQRQFGIEGMTDGSIEFKAPVTLTFPISLTDLPEGVTTAQLAVYWWNPSRNDWVKLGGVFNPQDNSISVPVYHFSTYAVMADTGAIPNRLAGEDRFGTAVAIAQHGWKAGADSVVLANAYAFPDALAAGPLAYKLNAPILLSDARTLTPATLAEMQRLTPKKIILIGGTAVLSQKIEDSLSAVYGQDNVIRYGGADRYATAAAIASALGTTGQAVIANGEDGHYADALAVSSYAAYHGAPILFTAAQALPDVSKQALTEQKVSASIVAGGEGAVSAGVYKQLPEAVRYGGADRYATATAIAAGLKLNLSQVFVTTGLNFPDALVAGNLAARSFSPLLLVDKDLPQTVQDFLAANKEAISGITVVGGEKVISTEQQSALQNPGGNNLPLPDAGTSGSAPADGKYTVEARALKEKSDELSMADQFLTEKATLTVNNGAVAAAMTWHGTEFITMDMLKELKYQKADGSFADVSRVFNSATNTLAINFEIADINKPTIMQVYAPAGMGESRPKFRLVFDPDTLAAVN